MDNAAYLKQIEDVIEKGKYKDDWSSLFAFQVPEWYRAAKFGIFIHWGLYSVPAFNNEWYSRNMYVKDSPEYEHHIKTYGAHKDFGYKDFIPLFTADKWDAATWAELFKQAGARYVVPVAEHHDGFQMYDSQLSDWNVAKMGPKRDILGELKEALEERELTFAASSHRAEHHWFMGVGQEFESDIKEPLVRGDFYWPSISEQPDQQKLRTKPHPTAEFLDDWLLRTCEIIDKYQPKLLYFDWWIQHEAYKGHLKKIAAYYYNRGVEWGFPTAICYKHDAFAFGSAIIDVERGRFAAAKPYYWQTDTAVARNSWCYTTSLDYKSSHEIICYLIDVVSKNANLLLNIGPKADGEIPEADRRILLDIGEWLAVNGEAIYDSCCWRCSEEGPTKAAEGQFTDGKAGSGYTSEDFRFTAANGCIYAICMAWPADGRVTVKSLGESGDPNQPSFHGLIEQVEILGCDIQVEWYADKDGLHVTAPGISSDYPLTIKVRVG
ncbi:MAG: alpha-L-fucosidase [Lachnospiraceae bacterium]|jgi:alpha-L-fucosidase|nr:alpha-L-fucosidase [Lachnospiraceae bacterium]